MKLRKFYRLFFFILISTNGLVVFSAEVQNRYRLSLLTYAQGSELYSIFGHSAIRVIDDSLNTDDLYNYGTFSFSNSNFYTDFLKGKLLYRLSKSPTENTMFRNNRDGRRIVENALTLNNKDTKKLVSMLEINYLPQNQNYYYDFFYDNCSTRILQIIDTASRFKLNKAYNIQKPISFRKHANNYLKTMPWIRFGINSLMGINSDKKAIGVEAAFLPDHLRLILLENSELTSSSDVILVKGDSNSKHNNMSSIYTMVGIFLIVLAISFWEYKKKLYLKFINHLIFWPGIIIGLLILFLWSYSDLNIYSYNLNLLWANPLFLLLLFRKEINHKLKATIILCLSIGMIYTVFYTNEWIIVIYSLLILIRISNPFLKLKQLAPNII